MEKLMLILLLFAAPAFSESAPEIYKEGNALYAEGKFGEAAQKYQEAADQGLRNWVLEYDLGNAFYRSGQIGKAVLHLERAFHLNSGQGDVVYNLNLATAKAGDPELPSTALASLAWRLFYFPSLNLLTVLVSMLFLVFVVTGAASLVGRRLIPLELGLLLGIVFIGIFSWLGVRIYLQEKPVGVVVASTAEVRSGPNTSYPAISTVPEGRRVLILEEQEPIQGWLEICVPQEGLKGWVPETSVDVI